MNRHSARVVSVDEIPVIDVSGLSTPDRATLEAVGARYPDVPVIIITGFSTEQSAIEAVNVGVAGYLTKPFRVPQVLSVAAKALGE